MSDCYNILSFVHDYWQPVAKKFSKILQVQLNIPYCVTLYKRVKQPNYN